MIGYLWVAIGGALGSVARYWFSGVVARHFGETFPWGTVLVNITGSFVIGFFRFGDRSSTISPKSSVQNDGEPTTENAELATSEISQ